MQSIYETGVGDIDRYIEQCIVVKVIKEQNRRNPQSVIDIANALRTDGLIQQPSDDISAPNMENGVVKQGTVKFAYSKSFDLKVFVLLMTNFRNLLIITNICIGVFRILHLWKSRISTNILKGICRFLPSTK